MLPSLKDHEQRSGTAAGDSALLHSCHPHTRPSQLSLCIAVTSQALSNPANYGPLLSATGLQQRVLDHQLLVTAQLLQAAQDSL
jgi:hypothetical protein